MEDLAVPSPHLTHAGRRSFACLLVLAAAVLLLAGTPVLAQTTGVTLQKLADYPLPGDTSRYDYLSFDPTSHRMYVAHLGQGVVRVFDTQTHTFIGTVEGVPGVHGVLAVPELGVVYASATSTNSIAVIDPQSLSVIASIPGGDYPDGLAYAPTVRKLYVSDERGGTDTVIDTANNEVVATIALGGEAGNSVFDPVSGRILVAVQTQNQLVAIDPATDTVVALHDTPGCVSPHGMVLDAERRFAFVGCQGNAKLAVMDMQTMQVTSLQPVGKTPDVLVFEPLLRLVYVAAEDGIVSIFSEDPLKPGNVRLVTNPNAGPNAHTIGLDTETRHVYLPTANILGAPVLREFEIQALQEPDD
jgi:YVTN family beta-propeller protein